MVSQEGLNEKGRCALAAPSLVMTVLLVMTVHARYFGLALEVFCVGKLGEMPTGIGKTDPHGQ